MTDEQMFRTNQRHIGLVRAVLKHKVHIIAAETCDAHVTICHTVSIPQVLGRHPIHTKCTAF